MALRICLGGSPPLCSFLRRYDKALLRPCLSSPVSMATASPSAATELSGGPTRRRRRKRVAFADSQGLALAVIHVFDEAEDVLSEAGGPAADPRLGGARDPDRGTGLVLDFVQPAADYLDLRNRLRAQQVCLETCCVQDRLLSGTVQVRNICFQKSVSVRITFDSWRSFRDVQCRYLNNVYACPDIDTFSFSVSLPQALQPSERVEFCVQYQTEDQTFWDNNHGNNYGLVLLGPKGPAQSPEGKVEVQRGREEEEEEVEFDPFGSPRTSARIFSQWQSWGHVETCAPYW